ncbi:hypothetical protein HanRHA438_Chr12g0571731 [Helianthus annuus]|nr:hypothetical protein HanIR_Chr12g0604971 [Helianthus annuus]KAJ0868184.1 hypothetical protein HanRHA438_Chr12g0571731 [Helianthus annuus]
MYKPRISPPDTCIRRSITHILPLIPPDPSPNHPVHLTRTQPVSHHTLPPTSTHKHNSHLPPLTRQRQMHLIRPMT